MAWGCSCCCSACAVSTCIPGVRAPRQLEKRNLVPRELFIRLEVHIIQFTRDSQPGLSEVQPEMIEEVGD